MTFLIADGVLPGNEGRGYVLRKIMRRAMRHGQKLGIEGAFLQQLTHDGRRAHEGGLPRARLPRRTPSSRVVAVEEERFATTLRQALRDRSRRSAGEASPAGRRRRSRAPTATGAFRLYDTYGLPLDFTEELAADRGLSVDHAGFERELAAQQERARQSSKMGAVKGDPVYMKLAEEGGKTDFLGYDGARGRGRPRPRGAEGRRARAPARGRARRASSSSTARPSTPCRAARSATAG